MFLFGKRLFFDAGSSSGDVAAASASFSFAEWPLARECSAVQCLWLSHGQCWVQSNLVATSLSCCPRLVHLLLPICCKMFYFSIVGFCTNCRVDQPIWVCSCTSRGNILFFSDPVCILSITPSTSRRLVDPTRHSTSSWAARGTALQSKLTRQGSLSKREWSRCRSDIPRRRSASKKSRSPKRNMCHSKRWCLIYIWRTHHTMQTLQLSRSLSTIRTWFSYLHITTNEVLHEDTRKRMFVTDL